MQSIIKPVEHDYDTLRRELYALVGKYPFMRLERLGKSSMGREILAIRIGNRPSYSLYAAAFHGKERITSAVALRFAERLCEAITVGGNISGISARRMFADRGIIIIPMVNPDGCDIAVNGAKACLPSPEKIEAICGGSFNDWNANGRGVDINRNFDAGWQIQRELDSQDGITGPAPSRYGGSRPESEAETSALTSLCRRMNIACVMALHTQGEEIYWKYGDRTPACAERMARILGASSGYTVTEPKELASHAGFKDWFINEFGRPGFTVELGRGKNPLAPEILDYIYPAAEEMMALLQVM